MTLASPMSWYDPSTIASALLFEGVWIDRALIDSVIEEAPVLADDVAKPATVLICCERGDYIISGDPGQGPVRLFIKEMPSEAEVFNLGSASHSSSRRSNGATSCPKTLAARFRSSQLGRSGIVGRTSCRSKDGMMFGIRDDARVQPVDPDMLVQIDRGALKTGKAFTVRGQEGGEITREWLAWIARDFFGF